MDDVADVDLAHAGDARDRRRQPRIAKLDVGLFDQRLVGLDGILQLRHLRLLGVEQLRRCISFALQLGVAIEIGQRIGELGLIAIAVGDHLVELGLIGARIDLREQVAGLDGVSLGKGDLGKLALDLAAHDVGVVGDHRADAAQVDRNVMCADSPREKWAGLVDRGGAAAPLAEKKTTPPPSNERKKKKKGGLRLLDSLPSAWVGCKQRWGRNWKSCWNPWRLKSRTGRPNKKVGVLDERKGGATGRQGGGAAQFPGRGNRKKTAPDRATASGDDADDAGLDDTVLPGTQVPDADPAVPPPSNSVGDAELPAVDIPVPIDVPTIELAVPKDASGIEPPKLRHAVWPVVGPSDDAPALVGLTPGEG